MTPDWLNHIELVVLASLIVLIVSSFVNSVVGCAVQRWILKDNCNTCLPSRAIPEIITKQTILRETTLMKLEVSMAEIKSELKYIRLILEGKENKEE